MLYSDGMLKKPISIMKDEKRDVVKKLKKQRHLRKRRIIVRNLSFKATEEDLKKIFSKYGNVLDVTIPLMENKKKRGFAFVQFERFNSLVKAMKEMNYKEILGRPVAIDYAVDKTKYCSDKMQEIKTESDSEDSPLLSETEIKQEDQSDIDSESDTDSDTSDNDKDEDVIEVKKEEDLDDVSDSEKRVQDFFKEFDAEAVNDEKYAESSESDTDDDDEDDDDDKDDVKDESDMHTSDEDEESESDEDMEKPPVHSNKKGHTKTISNDVVEGKTVFIRNLSFVTSDEDLKGAMSEFGDFVYCLLCIDKISDHPRGTAFVKFKSKESAEALIKKASEEPGITLDGRKLECSHAITRDEIAKKKEEKVKKPKDKRNLYLLDVGQLNPNSGESEGVSQSDMKKRAEVAVLMRQKLKHPKFFISDTRLAVHNIPPFITDFEFRKIFKDAAPPSAVLKEARVLRNFQKVNDKGVAASKGFGFVSFTAHEDSLAVLRKINNNPLIFNPQKRPIVEFSVENRNALLLKEKRVENSRLKIQQLKNANSEDPSKYTSAEPSGNNMQRKRNWQNKEPPNKRNRFNDSSVTSSVTKKSRGMQNWQKRETPNRRNKFKDSSERLTPFARNDSVMKNSKRKQNWQTKESPNKRNKVNDPPEKASSAPKESISRRAKAKNKKEMKFSKCVNNQSVSTLINKYTKKLANKMS